MATFKGHSSYITHLDWSLDGRIIQSNCGAYELLYSEAATGKQVRPAESPGEDINSRVLCSEAAMGKQAWPHG